MEQVSNGHGHHRPVKQELQEQAAWMADRATEIAKDVDQRTRVFVREHPTAAVLGAVAIGFLVGRLILVRR